MKKMLASVVAALICAVLGVVVMQQWKIGSLQQELVEMKREREAKGPVVLTEEEGKANAHDAAVAEESSALRQRLARVAPSAVLPPGMPTLPVERADSAVSAGPAGPEPKRSESPKPEEEAKPTNDLAKALGRMFTDPQMKDAMHQQESVAARVTYVDLARELGLSPDEADRVIALLAERKSAKTARTMSMLNPSSGGTSLEEIGKASLELEAEYQRRLKVILGAERYAKFEVYEKTVGDRLLVRQLQQNLAAGGVPLDEGQRDGLLKILTEAEESILPDAATGASGDPEERMRAVQGELEELHRRVLARAKPILTPEQSGALERVLAEWAQTQRAGMQMSRALFQGGR